MGEESRSDAFSAAIAAWLTYVLILQIERRGADNRLWVAYAVVLCAGIYTFLYLGLLVGVHAVVLASVHSTRAVWKRWAVAMAAGVVAATPVIVFGILERDQVAFLASRVEVTFTAIAVDLWFGDPLFAVVAWALIILSIVLAAVRLGRRRRAVAGWREDVAERALPVLPETVAGRARRVSQEHRSAGRSDRACWSSRCRG
jgi:mannosyltransferase